MTRLVVTVIVLGSLLAASYFMLPIENIAVAGSQRYDARELARMAGASRGNPWLWLGPWRASALEQDPWIIQATIIRRFPGTVEIRISERKPFAQYLNNTVYNAQLKRNEPVVVALDGTVLPDATPPKLEISGWGEDRLTESLKIASLLKDAQVKSVRYSPQGFTVVTAQGQLWTDSVASLLNYGRNVKISQGSRVSLYPWGVAHQ